MCTVCKFKVHKRCAPRAPDTCKWTSLASVGKDIIEDDGVSDLVVDLHCDLITDLQTVVHITDIIVIVHVTVVIRQHICETCERSAFRFIDVLLFIICPFTGRRL